MGSGTDGPDGPRRQLLATTAAGIGSLLLPPAWPAARVAAGKERSPLQAPGWDGVPACSPSATDQAGQGPFFIHNDESDDDVDLFRQDIRGRYNSNAEPGTDLHLHLRILDGSTPQCGQKPLQGVAVYVWHCDAQGFYSGFGEPGEQKPDLPYRFRPNQNDLDNNTRFCRGAGVTDGDGVVSFLSIFPGWYNGRDLHIHVMVLAREASSRGRRWYSGTGHLYTTQLYFEPELNDRVHKASEPYLRRTAHAAYPGIILGDERGSSGLRMKARFVDNAVTAQMQLVVDPARSRV